MTVKEFINISLLTEGIAENAGACGLDDNKLKKYLNSLKINRQDFLDQYPNFKVFEKRAFGMYNKVLGQGYSVNNSSNSFNSTILPILQKFYNSI